MSAAPRPPGPKNLGFLREVPRLRGGVLDYMVSLSRRYPDPLLLLQVDPFLAYLPGDPDVLHEMLVQIPERFSRSRWLGELRALVGEGLLFSSEADWVSQRRRLNAAYHGRHSEVVAEATRAEIAACLARWRAAPGGVVDVQAAAKATLLRAMVRVLLSPDAALDERQLIADLDTVLQFTSIRNHVVHYFARPLKRAREPGVRLALARIDAFIARLIDGCRSGELRAGLLLAELLPAEARGEVDAANIHDEIGTVLVAGFDTTAALVTFALGELAERPDLCASLRAEAGARAQPVTQQVVRETLRMYPPVWAVVRTAAEPIELGGFRVPKGEMVIACVYAIQRNPRFWPDPDRFLPERFEGMPESDARLGLAYLPFSHGRHTCIGKRMALLQAHLFLTEVVAAFDLERASRRPRLLPGVILTAAGGMPLRVRARPSNGRVAAGSQPRPEVARQASCPAT